MYVYECSANDVLFTYIDYSCLLTNKYYAV